MEDLETPVSADTKARKRQRPHNPTMWEKIKPSLKHFYIDLDMTLEDTMSEIAVKHDFHANKQMYKKRLKTWGLSKQVKTSEKEKALTRILHNDAAATDLEPIRHDKLVRYAKSRVKSGTLDSRHLARLAGRHVVVPQLHHAPPSMTRSPSPPDQFAEFDVFLHAMRALVMRERVEWLTRRQPNPGSIFIALRQGMALWRNHEFAAARKAFGQAARQTVDDLQGSEVSVTRVTYCVSAILWGAERELVFLKFADFMVNAALEILGPNSPMTVVLKHIRAERSVEAQVRIWNCALDGYDVSDENVEHWWHLEQRRWQWCRRSGMPDLAAQHCRHAMNEARKMNKLTAEKESEAQLDLDQLN